MSQVEFLRGLLLWVQVPLVLVLPPETRPAVPEAEGAGVRKDQGGQGVAAREACCESPSSAVRLPDLLRRLSSSSRMRSRPRGSCTGPSSFGSRGLSPVRPPWLRRLLCVAQGLFLGCPVPRTSLPSAHATPAEPCRKSRSVCRPPGRMGTPGSQPHRTSALAVRCGISLRLPCSAIASRVLVSVLPAIHPVFLTGGHEETGSCSRTRSVRAPQSHRLRDPHHQLWRHPR